MQLTLGTDPSSGRVVWLQVLTFDAVGVSGHLNHRCVHAGVRCAPACLCAWGRCAAGARCMTGWPTGSYGAHSHQLCQHDMSAAPCRQSCCQQCHGCCVRTYCTHCCCLGGACRQLLCSQGRALGVQQGWQLVSEALLVKYSCLAALPLVSALRQPRQVVLLGGSLLTSLRAMAAHYSQWVW